MTLTFSDIEKLSKLMSDHKDELIRELFSCFDKADYDRGDKIILAADFAGKIEIPSYASDRITISPFVEGAVYIVITGKIKERERDWLSLNRVSILENPSSLINLNCSA